MSPNNSVDLIQGVIAALKHLNLDNCIFTDEPCFAKKLKH